MEQVLHTDNLSIGYGSKVIASGLNVSLNSGELVCLVGANGSGKSTLLRTISGLQATLEGNIHVGDNLLNEMSPHAVSQQIAMVLTDKPDTVNLKVGELVALGRSPYTNWLGSLRKEDKAAINTALEQTHTHHLANRLVKTLSDGQKQRVMIAKALAQDTPLLFLDEPTAHLDLPNRVAILHLLHQLARETNKTVLLSTHELDLALQVADQLWLFDKNEQLHCDIPEALILDQTLSAAFDSDLLKFSSETGQFELQKSTCTSISLTGEGLPFYWTKRALERIGFEVTETKQERRVEIEETWTYHTEKDSINFNTLTALIDHFRRK